MKEKEVYHAVGGETWGWKRMMTCKKRQGRKKCTKLDTMLKDHHVPMLFKCTFFSLPMVMLEKYLYRNLQQALKTTPLQMLP